MYLSLSGLIVSLGKDVKKAAVIGHGVVPRLIQLLLHTSVGVQAPALRTIGNLVTGNDEQTQSILDQGVLSALLTLLTHSKKAIRREACWTISNITAGTEHQIQQVIQQNIIPQLIKIMSVDDSDVQREAAWAVANAISGGNDEQIKYIVSEKCLPPMCRLLEKQETRVILILLEAIEKILRVGKKYVCRYVVMCMSCISSVRTTRTMMPLKSVVVSMLSKDFKMLMMVRYSMLHISSL